MRTWIRRKIIAAAVAYCMAGGILTGCSSRKAEDSGKNAKMEIEALALADYPKEPVYNTDEERWDRERELRSGIEARFLEAYESFIVSTASALLCESSDNVVYSPLGLYYALAIAAEGAAGENEIEILQLLNYGEKESLAADCQSSFQAIYHVPNEKNNKPGEGGEYPSGSRYTLTLANSLWADTSVPLKKEFVSRAAEYFYADIFTGDLHSGQTAEAMADWVKERTNGLIAPPADAVGAETVLSLKNTMYFYDEWLDRFDKEKTKVDTFTCADGTEVTCDFMNRTMASHGFRRGENYIMSSLSLKNGAVEFYLPDVGTNVHELVKDSETLRRVTEGTEGSGMGEVVWKIPKFSYGSSTKMEDMLKELGMQAAFEENADFSGISDSRPLWLSAVSQEAHIGIDENGVEAAAYTELSWAGAALPTERADMILDRPFLYVIKNRGMVIFVGICENPAE